MVEYAQKKSDCTACGLRDQCAAVIRGVGSLTADILVVGSFPDDVSELRNEPFHPDGFCGRQLDRVRELLCLSWDDLRLTYAVACRPEGKPPTRREIETCRYWLQKEEMRMTCARLEAMQYGNELVKLAHPILLGIGNEAAQSFGLVPWGAPAIEACGRWYSDVPPFRNNQIFCLQGFETLLPPVIPTIRYEWSQHLDVFLRGLQIAEIGEDIGRSVILELKEIQNNPFMDDQEITCQKK